MLEDFSLSGSPWARERSSGAGDTERRELESIELKELWLQVGESELWSRIWW